jgi:hypothetical protein
VNARTLLFIIVAVLIFIAITNHDPGSIAP